MPKFAWYSEDTSANDNDENHDHNNHIVNTDVIDNATNLLEN